MALVFTLLITKYLVLSIIFILLGGCLRTKLNLSNPTLNQSFWLAADYFTGFIFFFAIFRTTDFIIHSFRVSCLVSIVAAIVFIIINRYAIQTSTRSYLRLILRVILLFGPLIVFFMAYWVQSDLQTAFSTSGSLHSVRYANIAHYILFNNTIPVIGQNYVQSVIAAIPLIGASPLILLSITVFLALNISFFILFVYAFLQSFIKDKIAVITATVLICCGGFSLSTKFYLLVDSGTPWILNGYSDSIIGLATFMVILVLAVGIVKQSRIQTGHFIIGGVSIIGWMALAVQNVFLLGILVLIFLIRQYKTKQLGIKMFMQIAIAFIFSAILGISQGGMLTPKMMQSKTDIPGLLTLEKKERSFISILPGLPYHTLTENISKENQYGGVSHFAWLGLENRNSSFFVKAFHALGLNIFAVIVITFFLSLRWVKKQAAYHDQEMFISFFHLSTIIIIAGLSIAFPFRISAYKWELSRFLMPGYFLYATLLSICIFNWADEIKPKFGRYLLIIVSIFLCIGTTKLITQTLHENFKLENFHKNFKTYLAPYDHYIK